MDRVLTPEQVHDVESFTLGMLKSGQWPDGGEYIADAVYARLEQSHEALRAQRDEAVAACDVWARDYAKLEEKIEQLKERMDALQRVNVEEHNHFAMLMEDYKKLEAALAISPDDVGRHGRGG